MPVEIEGAGEVVYGVGGNEKWEEKKIAAYLRVYTTRSISVKRRVRVLGPTITVRCAVSAGESREAAPAISSRCSKIAGLVHVKCGVANPLRRIRLCSNDCDAVLSCIQEYGAEVFHDI